MSSLSLKAPAKVNLYLEITGNRPDGYHDLVMVLQSINLSDRIDIRITGTDQIHVHCDHPEVPTDHTNLVHKAAKLLQNLYPDFGGVEIFITKNIPVGAGLAGGSSDAAAVLVGIDRLWNLGLTQGELQELAAQLGSDVPFCIGGGTVLAVGRGEVLSPLPPLENLALVICKPRNLGISTAWAYNTFRAQGLLATKTPHSHSSQILAAIASRDESSHHQIARLLYNDLERVVLPTYPQIAELKKQLQAQESLGVLMSGSGSTVFAIARNLESAQRIADSINQDQQDKPDQIDVWVTSSAINGIQDWN
ncbi:4-(cytidine 5'-diphospho)-2-C-methyl-D-erythritol kinase [Synechococcus sp. PCC 7502]|uniref:4-(cytidine 5'-diphospho)-2-C-methyl-D-erythritol kinase n=1 Tax=Synechococcus sp. PCC 7502 TaxID=1173263 RepID=UPI0002FC75F2|nr:4-(cytidine 5'-diphospho)-2-C-methyl-D-erythritol kinase [Synechococcus sp. PCC 7502]